LNWLLEQIDAHHQPFDVGVIVDADTRLDPGFLKAMDRAFASGAVAAQGYYSVLDPGNSRSAGLRYAALTARHHLRPLGRCRLRASAGLYGNGMAFAGDILRRHEWTGHLVEDAEFQMELLLKDGIFVTYVADALLEAEMPDTSDAATTQNTRWERGRIELARRYVPKLLRQTPRAPQRLRVAYIDAILDHMVPPLSVLAAWHIANVGCAGAAWFVDRRRARQLLVVDAVASTILVVHVLVALRAANAPPSVYRSLMGAPKMICWKLLLWLRALLPGTTVEWTRTARNAEQ
jgi:hypothetical protein